MLYILLILAIAPALFFLWFFYSRDKYEKEPLRIIFFTYVLGMISVIPAIILETIGSAILPPTESILSIIIHSFIIIGLSEEFSKLLATLPAFRSIHFNETMDGIVYGASAALGFATIENLFYVLEGGVATGILRAILTVPGHALDGAILGYFLGLAKFNRARRGRLIITGLGLSTILHGFWDFFSLTGIIIGVIVVYLIGWSLFFKYRRLSLKTSIFRKDYCIYCGTQLINDYRYCLKCGRIRQES